MAEVTLTVNGFEYGGWKSIRITRSIESLAGQFTLDVSDRWGGNDDPWTIFEEDPCQVAIDGQVVIDGYIDKPSLGAEGNARTLSYTGRDRAAALVDNSADLAQWTFHNLNLAEFATKLAKPFGITVYVEGEFVLPPIPKIVVSPGEKIYEAIKKAAGAAGVLLVSDGAGDVTITRGPGPGVTSMRAAALVEGSNILGGSVERDPVERFYKYVVLTQVAGTDEAYGDATRVRAEAFDLGVRRKERVLVIRSEKGYSLADARKRADWEARVRAARSETLIATVQDWKQPDGSLWPLNALTHVTAPKLFGVDEDLLISRIDHTIANGGGTTTQLHLMRPDAFTPEPKATVKASTGYWAELKNGAL